VCDNLTVKTELPEDDADKLVGVLAIAKHCNLVHEKWCIKRWFEEDR